MSLNGKRPAVTIALVTGKKIGKDINREYEIGAKCLVQRSPACLGEFILWFQPGNFFKKVDAVQLKTFIKYTDGKAEL